MWGVITMWCSSQNSNGKLGHSFICLFSFNLSKYAMGTDLIKLIEAHNLASSFFSSTPFFLKWLSIKLLYLMVWELEWDDI